MDTKKYYADDYRKEYSHNAEAAKTNARELYEVYRRYQQSRLDLVHPYLTATTRLLEVGASAGQFLGNVRDQIALVNAIELDRECCAFMRSVLGIEAESEFLADSAYADGAYDVVCAFQVMEHVPDPVGFLADLRKATKKGGIIFVEVPNLDDPLLSVWGNAAYRDFFFHAAHMHYFTESSLRKVAYAAGFTPEVVRVKYTQDYNLLNHLNWIMNHAPQATCHVGLSPISFTGNNLDIASWLTGEMARINAEYVAKLVEARATSNMMMMIKND